MNAAPPLTKERLHKLETIASETFEKAYNFPVKLEDVHTCRFGLMKIVAGTIIGATLGTFNGIRSCKQMTILSIF